MSSYYAIFNDDASGNFSVSVVRGTLNSEVPTTDTMPRLVIPWIDNMNSGTTVYGVEDATNAAPIVLQFDATDAANPYAVGDVIVVQDVGGNTTANGTFEVSAVGGSSASWTATLKGSDGTAAYTSGGTVYKISRTKLLGGAIEAAKKAILNDRSVNG